MSNNEYDIETVNAYSIGCQTLVGVMSGDFPKRGNCFDLLIKKTPDNRSEMTGAEVVEFSELNSYRVLNFHVENLEELIKRGIVEFPVKVHLLSEKHCVIQDERIPDEWYNKSFCNTCSPHRLLPLPQQMEFAREIERGDIEIIRSGGYIIQKTKVTPQTRKLKGNWTIEEGEPEIIMGEGLVEELEKLLIEEVKQDKQDLENGKL